MTRDGDPVTTADLDLRPSAFHEGELAVQRRAGVQDKAARLAGMLDPGELRDAQARFLADRTFAALTGRAADGRLWVSPLSGPPGFLDVTGPTTLTVHAIPGRGDPLHDLAAGQPVGLVVVEFATRRRVRINGTLGLVGPDRLRVDVEQAYGNCPKYIQQRALSPVTTEPHDPAVRREDRLAAPDVALIRGADTFFIGTAHPGRGADASHRGGPTGFVRVDDGELWWPDYSGNNMFNTLGNLSVDPAAALLFPEFGTGRTLQLSGTARTEWLPPGGPGDDDSTGRLVRFTPHQIAAGRQLHVRAGTTIPYVDNPPLRDNPSNRQPE
jgi:predicted pyridoxine 5'-phosphate oxidase superfamily flavin-nucleotide-binding protein